MRKGLTLIGEHANAVLFVLGFAVFEAGLSAYSGQLAAMVGGGIVMVIAAWPFLRLRRQG